MAASRSAPFDKTHQKNIAVSSDYKNIGRCKRGSPFLDLLYNENAMNRQIFNAFAPSVLLQ
jgi:hypothetical protein